MRKVSKVTSVKVKCFECGEWVELEDFGDGDGLYGGSCGTHFGGIGGLGFWRSRIRETYLMYTGLEMSADKMIDYLQVERG